MITSPPCATQRHLYPLSDSDPAGLCDATGCEVPQLQVGDPVEAEVLPGRDERRPLQEKVLPVHVRRPLCEAPGPSVRTLGRGRGHPSARSGGSSRCSPRARSEVRQAFAHTHVRAPARIQPHTHTPKHTRPHTHTRNKQIHSQTKQQHTPQPETNITTTSKR